MDCACGLAVKLEMNLDGTESLSSILICKCLKVKIYRAVILYGYEPLSRAMREERRLRVLERRVLRRIFGLCRLFGLNP